MSKCKFLKNYADCLRPACLLTGEVFLFLFLFLFTGTQVIKIFEQHHYPQYILLFIFQKSSYYFALWLSILSLWLCQFSSVQSFNDVRLFASPWTAAQPVFLVHHQLPSLLRFMSIKLVMPSNHLILCHPLLLLPTIFPSIRVFSNQSVLPIRWPNYWSFSFSISPSNEYSGLISFKMLWFDLLAVQGTLKSLIQHHSSKVSILQYSAFFVIQLSHWYMTTGKTIALTRHLSAK